MTAPSQFSRDASPGVAGSAVVEHTNAPTGQLTRSTTAHTFTRVACWVVLCVLAAPWWVGVVVLTRWWSR